MHIQQKMPASEKKSRPTELQYDYCVIGIDLGGGGEGGGLFQSHFTLVRHHLCAKEQNDHAARRDSCCFCMLFFPVFDVSE